VKKIIAEILALVWKVLRLYVWKWLAPYIGKLAFFAFIGFALFAVAVVLLFGAC
jgi:hypothetical protein